MDTPMSSTDSSLNSIPPGGEAELAQAEDGSGNGHVVITASHVDVDVDGLVADTTTTCHGRTHNGMDWISRCTWFMTLLIVGGAVGAAILVWHTQGGSRLHKTGRAGAAAAAGGGGTQKPSEPTTSLDSSNLRLPLNDYYDLLYQHLWNVRHVAGLQDPSTPTYEALEWMAFQDGAKRQLLLKPQQQQQQQQPPKTTKTTKTTTTTTTTTTAVLNVVATDQRFALACLFFSTAGPGFWDAKWLVAGADECQFDGVGCDRNGRVTSIELFDRSLLGPLPLELAWLAKLQKLDLNKNQLQGAVPAAYFQQLGDLQYFDLSFNQLTGTLPDDWSYLSHLEHANAQGNSLTGSLPRALPVRTLRFLSLSLNEFTGTLPVQEWNAQARWYDALFSNISLFEDENGVNNTINNGTNNILPGTNYTNGTVALQFLDLGRNLLNGTLHPSMGHTLAHLNSIGLYQTSMEGTIPTEIGLLTELQEISVADTHFTGTMPMELYQLTDLQWLVLSASKVEGSFPTDIQNLTQLQVLNVVDTNWYGTLPTELGLLTDLQWLQVSDTNIGGTIPSELGQLSQLSKL